MVQYPDLSSSSLMGVDIETYDPNLTNKGNGVYRNDGYILGMSLAVDGFSCYYNLGHQGITADERDKNLRYLSAQLGTNVPKIGAKFLYDLDWIENWLGVKVNGKLNDVQIAEPLLDEYAVQYNLDYLAHKYLGKGKYKTEIEQFCEDRGLKGDSRKHLYLMPYELVKKYAEEDAAEPLEIFKKQFAQIRVEGLESVYAVEMRLYPLLIEMRKNGVRLDNDRRVINVDKLTEYIDKHEKSLFGSYGAFNYNSSPQTAKLLDRLGVAYPRHPKDDKELKDANMDFWLCTGSPKIDTEFFECCEHPVAQAIMALKKAKKLRDGFLIKAFSDHQVDGRIHCDFLPLKQDEGGTVTGRLSAQNINLQQVPRKFSKDDLVRLGDLATLGDLCREVFIPEEGCWWGKVDYSQIEYRVIANYAVGPKSDYIRKLYTDNPDTDFHSVIQEWTGLDRPTCKRINFGSAYFMGVRSMARKFNWSIEKAQEFTDKYFDMVPFMKPTRNNVVEVAKARGYVHTVLGRRARVSPIIRSKKKEYILFNHLIQGTAADIFKKGAVDAYEAGVFDVLTPHIFVHDEHGVSVPKTKEGVEAYAELKHCMENTIKLKVPLVAEAEIGNNWGHVSAFDKEKLLLEV